MTENEDKIAEVKKADAKAAEAKAKAEEKAKAKEEADAKAAEVAESTEGLVKMHKDGEILHVHPTTVESHKSAGWKHA
jgi:membrane protein involved in colicin uptake